MRPHGQVGTPQHSVRLPTEQLAEMPEPRCVSAPLQLEAGPYTLQSARRHAERLQQGRRGEGPWHPRRRRGRENKQQNE